MLKLRQLKWYRRMVWMGAFMIGGLLVACGGKTEETEKVEDVEIISPSAEEIEEARRERLEAEEKVAYDKTLPDTYWTDFEEVCKLCGIKTEEIDGFTEAEDWGHGERYAFKYRDEKYLVDFLVDGYVRSLCYQSVADGLREEYYRRGYTTGYQVGYEAQSIGEYQDVMILVTNDTEPYGEVETIDGREEVRYYVPEGNYLVRAKAEGSGLYVETVALHEENGHEMADVLEEIVFGNLEEEYEIAIRKGECIGLMAGSIVELEAL